MEAELLRSVDWFNAHAVPPVGQSMRLDLPEMGAEGDAIVTSIEACPEIAPGRGRLVVSRFRHSQGEVYDLRLVGSDGIIGVTAHHPLWSATRGAWVSAAELEPGEHLRGITQTADSGIGEGAGVVVAVASLLPRGQEPVYNIEVEGDHCYRVGEQGLLVHNSSLQSNPSGQNDASAAACKTLAEWLPGVPDSAMIHLTPEPPSSLAAGITETYWVRFGDVKHLTIPLFKRDVVGVCAPAYCVDAKYFAVKLNPVIPSMFQPDYHTGPQEYTNAVAIIPDSIVEVPEIPHAPLS
ncbi:Uncharacterized protein OS=Planctomyces maris DSM 8797 GN=PM8797T_02084 PE=4 SV=1: PT-HINT [Tuwongella immobilis]|uniref:Uncharacterized protein n=1 Tax=Tuwongella immobilis TaxID=692036 RepID=A0A6C2YQY0_9BACT|nr:Uncharacterized protein OS=Planctomyces maris DSM 8797 GN=PM8797T_02084 PE=4 SV=1: PT-HINT [Tuwongella immobilis]VTS04850.1 Uncharacterized protein OS=Planctomyces maris DSM 8797 GN=PM8797T_02084 PE=4 SV=1: PT-HINT [Tuwongella immobilis]